MRKKSLARVGEKENIIKEWLNSSWVSAAGFRPSWERAVTSV